MTRIEKNMPSAVESAHAEEQVDTAISVRSVSKSFGTNLVLDEVSIDVKPGEFFSILGPSGCGKTTLMRIIAGFDFPDSGEVFLSGEEVSRRAPNKRDLNMVFQNYALFPHLNVAENVGFELKVRRVPSSERARRVADALELVRLAGFGNRKVSELSGGQRQRVALARAVVSEPKLVLLDEPLAALDLKLREEMQVELKRLQQELGLAFVYVTHDQGEALSMSDRIAVMHAGRVEQIATPTDLYRRPAGEFVARFIGTASLIDGTVSRTDRTIVFTALDGSCAFEASPDSVAGTSSVSAVIRPEAITVLEEEHADGTAVVVEHAVFTGSRVRVTATLGEDTPLVFDVMGDAAAERIVRGRRLLISIDPGFVSFVPRNPDRPLD